MPYMFPAVIAKGISQAYHGSRLALAGLNMTVEPGRITAIVGQSGAGKTALAEILGGIARPATGSMHLQGQLVSLRSEQDAIERGIRYVKQTWDRHSRVTVADAVQLEAVPKRFGLVDAKALADRVRGHLSMFGLEDVDPKAKLCELSMGQQKMVQVAAALAKPPLLLVLDDPAASLNAKQTEVLYQKLSQLQYANTGIVYCTPSADEALAVGDQVCVLRDGHLIAIHDPDGLFVHQLIGEMAGRDIPTNPHGPIRAYGPEVALRVEGLRVEHCVNGLALKVKRGEVLGLLGLHGAGQSEAIRAIGAAEPRTDGEIFLRASAVPAKVRTREEALANGIGLIADPWGRLSDSSGADAGYPRGQLLRGMNAENPQRSAIAKCLTNNCSVLLFDNPTRGLNVACRLEVYKAIQNLADYGMTIVAASTDPEELMSFCDRIALVAGGRIVRTVERDAFSAESLLEALKRKS